MQGGILLSQDHYFLHHSSMDTLSNGEERIFGHQISCLVLIYHSCKIEEGQGRLSSVIERNRREVIGLLLDLLQRLQLEYAALLKSLDNIGTKEMVEAFNERMHGLVKDKFVAMFDFFECLETLTQSGNQYIERNSLFGIFVRKMLLKYQKMNFHQTGLLGQTLESYINVPKPEHCFDDAPSVNSMDIEEDSHQTTEEKMNSLSEVERFITQQVKMLESESITTSSPKKLQEKINEIFENFPDAVDAYYLSYLNHLQVGEVRNALFDLHRYFDYQKWEEEQISSNGDADKNSAEKYQMKFRRFRYCALNLGILHCCLGHQEAALAAVEEAVKMAQITNDNDCLLHSLFWLHRLKSKSDPSYSQSLLEQFNKRAKELGYSQMQSLGTLIQCRFDAFSGNATFEKIQSKLNTIDSMTATKSEVPARQIQIGRSALLDFFGFRAVACHASQIALYEAESRTENSSSLSGLPSFKSQDPKSTILALCQTSRFLADEGLISQALEILQFGTTLVPEHSSNQEWLSICKWQLVFERCIFQRDITGAKQAVEELRPLDHYDADLRECQVLFLSGNVIEAASKLEDIRKVVEKIPDVTIGNTPTAIYQVRALQLKAELFASSKEFPRAVDYLVRCMDLCRKYKMKSIEAEISICLAQCKIQLGLPKQSKSILNKQMIQILSHGTLYVRSLAFLVLAKASLFCLKGEFESSKSELLSLLPMLEKTLWGFQLVNAEAQQCETLHMMAQIYNVLEYTKERNKCAKELRQKLETVACNLPVKLFI